MVLLQAVPSLGIFETLANYGALGLISLGLGFTIWFLLKRQINSEEKCEKRVEELQKEITDYIKTDQVQLRSIVENNTKALNELKDLILKK
jgi:hypothetical protein